MPILEDWSNFFITTGAAGGTLVGLLFVVVTLGAGLPTARKLDIAHASLTPALYSFASVLLQSMVLLVPWPSNGPSGVIFVAMGIGGLIYRIKAVRIGRTLHLRAIQSTMDRIIHNLTPIDPGLRHLGWRRSGIDRRRAIGAFRHRGLICALPFLGNLPNLGANPCVD